MHLGILAFFQRLYNLVNTLGSLGHRYDNSKMLRQHKKETFPFKHIQGKALKLDVYLPDPRPKTSEPVVLYFHGGYLVSTLSLAFH